MAMPPCYIYNCVIRIHIMCLYSIWQRNLALTPCGLVICKPRLVWSSCLGVLCLEGKNEFFSQHITKAAVQMFLPLRELVVSVCDWQVWRSFRSTDSLDCGMCVYSRFLSAVGHSRPSHHAVHTQTAYSLYACSTWWAVPICPIHNTPLFALNITMFFWHY